MTSPDRWARDAARLPLAFAQVREDPALDQWVVERAGPEARVLMVASGGCTAAALAAAGSTSAIHVVDANPAQIALTRLKLALLGGSSIRDRLHLLGHAPLPSREREAALRRHMEALELPLECLGPVDEVARLGPDHTGRYELLFTALRLALREHDGSIECLLADLLELEDPREQARRVAAGTTLGRAIDETFDAVLSLPNLVALFGEAATRNPSMPFARHFARRVRWVLEHQGASRNPFLWQMLLGRFPAGVAYPWLMAPAAPTMPRVTWTVGTIDEVLESRRGDCDVVHLSNILDWLSPDSAESTLDRAWHALAPGGWVFIRQLNSLLEIPALGGRFAWDGESAERLLGGDRSFFYRSLHVGRKR